MAKRLSPLLNAPLVKSALTRIVLRMWDRYRQSSARLVDSIALAVVALGVAGRVEVAAAQSTLPLSALRVGDTVRAWTPEPPIYRTVAAVASIGSDNLMLTDLPGQSRRIGVVDVPVGALTRLQVRRDTKSSTGDLVAGAALGAACGFLITLFMSPVLCASCDWIGSALAFAQIGAVPGVLIGAYLGGSPRPRWRTVALPQQWR